MTLSAVLSDAKILLKNAKIESCSIDAEALLMHVLSFSRSELYMRNELLLDEKTVGEYAKLIEQRLKNMPLAYIINACEFMSLPFYVDENVLIPRNDTEILTETTIKIINENDYTLGLEIGVGSGSISVSLAKYCERLKIIGFDISQRAIEVAGKNAHINKVENQTSFHQSDLFDKLPEQAYGKLDFVISNPPYIATEIIPDLDANVKDFEPHSALDGGTDGLMFYRNITGCAKQYLTSGGHLLFEIGYDQAEAVREIMVQNGFGGITVIQDLAGLDRVIYGVKEGYYDKIRLA